MHELSICQGILRIIEEQAVAQQFSSVETVHIEVGPFAGVEIHALRFGFDVASKGTIAQNATLEISRLPIKARCISCMKQINIEQRYDACPICGKYKVEVIGGTELRIKDLEVS